MLKSCCDSHSVQVEGEGRGGEGEGRAVLLLLLLLPLQLLVERPCLVHGVLEPRQLQVLITRRGGLLPPLLHPLRSAVVGGGRRVGGRRVGGLRRRWTQRIRCRAGTRARTDKSAAAVKTAMVLLFLLGQKREAGRCYRR